MKSISLSLVLFVLISCTPQERALALSADQAACAVLQAIDKKDAATIAAVCAVELPIASAVVQAVGDAGAKP